jgi:hypothetical protein
MSASRTRQSSGSVAIGHIRDAVRPHVIARPRTIDAHRAVRGSQEPQDQGEQRALARLPKRFET